MGQLDGDALDAGHDFIECLAEAQVASQALESALLPKRREEDRVVMEHMLHPQPGYPFSLALSVEYLLSEEDLLVRTTATNRGPRP